MFSSLQVYRGTWRGLDVAVKTMVLPVIMSGAQKKARMALLEAAISTTLVHPNIVQVGTRERTSQLPAQSP